MSASSGPSHLDAHGKARMVDVGDKPRSRRTAEARAVVRFPPQAFARLQEGDAPKGGVVETARIAGIQAAKRTAELIPLCHGLELDHVDVEIEPLPGGEAGLSVRCRASLEARTGVEMEAMTGAAVAALTIYDMCKALDKGIRVEELRLVAKTGGKSGTWRAQ